MVVNYSFSLKQQAETQIKRRIGIGNHISERKLIDEFTRMGMNESIVSRNLEKLILILIFHYNWLIICAKAELKRYSTF